MTNEIIQEARRAGRTALGEIESKQLVAAAGIPVIESRLARTGSQAVALAREIGFPVALKIASPDILHKSDAGGVRLGLAGPDEVDRAFTEMLEAARGSSPGARIDGVAVQRMARPGVEVILGMSRDAQFGPVLMFGLGGVLVEVLEDVAFGIVPLERRDARRMIREIRGLPLLQGHRGREPADLGALEEMLLRLSELVDRTSEIHELDLNPVLAHRDGAEAVDARVILGGAA